MGSAGATSTPRVYAAGYAFVVPRACAGLLDRAEHLRNDADALAQLWSTARVLHLDAEGRAHATSDKSLHLRAGADIAAMPPDTAVFLGVEDGQAWFALDSGTSDTADAPRAELRAAATHWPALHALAFAQARALQHWRQRHRYCGTCGGEMRFSRGGWLGTCTQCATEHYPRTDPAVIVAVSDGERLLLGRQAGWPARRWSVLAGFVEPGESLEQTVAREVLEETGVRVRRCRYLASQPWPFPGALMLGFVAEAEPDEPSVTDELEAARWFTREEIIRAWDRDGRVDTPDDDGDALLSSPISISRWLIGAWLDGQGVDA